MYATEHDYTAAASQRNVCGRYKLLSSATKIQLNNPQQMNFEDELVLVCVCA
jgi:hypothetical protein